MTSEANGETPEAYMQQEATVETVEEQPASLRCEGELTGPLGAQVPFRYEEDVEDGSDGDMNVLTFAGDKGETRTYFDSEDEQNLDLDTEEYTEREAERVKIELPNGRTIERDLDDVVFEEVEQMKYNTVLKKVWQEAQENPELCRTSK